MLITFYCYWLYSLPWRYSVERSAISVAHRSTTTMLSAHQRVAVDFVACRKPLTVMLFQQGTMNSEFVYHVVMSPVQLRWTGKTDSYLCQVSGSFTSALPFTAWIRLWCFSDWHAIIFLRFGTVMQTNLQSFYFLYMNCSRVFVSIFTLCLE